MLLDSYFKNQEHNDTSTRHIKFVILSVMTELTFNLIIYYLSDIFILIIFIQNKNFVPQLWMKIQNIKSKIDKIKIK